MEKKELIDMLNKALEMEHQAMVQYLSYAELVSGIESEPVIGRLKEIANDEKEHAEKFREMIGAYLDGVPSTKFVESKPAKDVKEILKNSLADEKEAVDFYSKIMDKLKKEKDDLPYEFLKLEHELRHIIMDEMEHIAEIKNLM